MYVEKIKKYLKLITEQFFEVLDDMLNFWGNNKIYFISTIIYFYISFKILGGTVETFFNLIIIYLVTIFIAFSPTGEKLLKLLNNVRPLETSKEKEYILPLFEEVFKQAKSRNKYLNKIEICVIDNMTVNAMAIGRHTVAVTKGAVQTFTEEELKAVIAHEVAHIVHEDTTARLYAIIGNGIFTIILFIYKLILFIFECINETVSRNKNVLSFFITLIRFILEISTFLFTFALQIVMMTNSRKNEFNADKFSYDLGYDREMIEALYLLEKISLGDNSTIIQKMTASHPRITKRIEYLESLDEQSE